jgi:rhodanese-related sulfurtransferase
MNIFVIGLIVLLLLGGYLVFGQNIAKSDLEKVYGNPEKLVELVEKKSEPFILVDVRTPEEYASGHIPGAINIPHDVIGSQLPTQDRDALIILYCRSGNRSGIAKKTLEAAGFKKVVNFGAVSRWPKERVTGTNP